MTNGVAALALEDVTCRFAGRDGGAPYTAVANTTLKVAAGEFVSVVGPTGCGKSTLLNIAAGLLSPSTGSIAVFGEKLLADQGVNRRAGYMFQADALMPWRTGIANVIAGLEFRGTPRAEALAEGEAWLRRVGLAGFGDRYPHQLSGGMRKRLALAQTLILSPDILLMDEPFSALDVQTRQLMENELLALWAEDRKSVLFITHDLECALRPRGRAVGGPGDAADRRLHGRPATAARRVGNPHDARVPGAAPRDLGGHEGGSIEGLCRAEGQLTACACVSSRSSSSPC
jgi:NitT/TauT family transport system ATP-binding protein